MRDSLMGNVVSYIDQYDPGFRRRIRGATLDELDSLEKATGHLLPPDYRNFLSTMGRDDGGLLSQPGMRVDVSSILSFYQEHIASGENSVPEDCIVIAESGIIIEQLYLEWDGLGRIFEGGDGQKCSLWAASLRNLLYQNAYMSYRQRSLPHALTYTSAEKTSSSEAVREVVCSAGLSELDISDAVTICAESSATTLAYRQIAGESAWVRVAGTDKAAVSDLAKRLVGTCRVTLKPIA